MLESEIVKMMIANAPAVAVLMWLTYRLELRLSACIEKQGEFTSALLEMLGVSSEAPHTE